MRKYSIPINIKLGDTPSKPSFLPIFKILRLKILMMVKNDAGIIILFNVVVK